MGDAAVCTAGAAGVAVAAAVRRPVLEIYIKCIKSADFKTFCYSHKFTYFHFAYSFTFRHISRLILHIYTSSFSLVLMPSALNSALSFLQLNTLILIQSTVCFY